jgi:pimeloyl-ACP methyl ester carboxylesterase
VDPIASPNRIIRPGVLILLALLLPACRATGDGASDRVVSQTALFDGQLVHYLDAGGDSDEALVLIHGWASSTVAWRHQFPALADRARVLNVDLIGHGKSELPRGDLDMALMADSVVAAMDDAGVARAVFVGHSNGVPVAQNVWRRHPERTLAIVGIDGTLQPLFEREDVAGFFELFRGSGWRDVVAGMIVGMQAPDMTEVDRAALLEMALATPQETIVDSLDATLDDDAWTDEPLTVPLLLVLAAQPQWDEAYEAKVRERASRLDYRVWQGVGHFVQFERPDEFRTALLEFLDAHDLLR